MKQNLDDLQAGQIMLVVKNEDGSFSPLGISPSQAVILNRLMGSFSESEPFVVNREVKLVIEKQYGKGKVNTTKCTNANTEID